MPSLRIAFWNVFNLFDIGAVKRGPQSSNELHAKLDAVGSCINRFFAASGPDILGLAEIGSLPLVDEIRKRLNWKYSVRWQPPLDKTRTGLALLFRDGVISNVLAQECEMSVSGRPTVMMVTVLLKHNPTEPVVIFVCHWRSRMSGGGPARLASGAWVRDQLDKLGPGKCVVVMGDFNAEPFESPFGGVGLRAGRHFGSALQHHTIYNASWRFLTEPDFWDMAQKAGYKLTRTKTTHDAANVVFDHILVSSAALRGGPLELLESTVAYHADVANASRTDRRIAPQRFKHDGATNTSVGVSDHFPVTAEFRMN